VINNEKEKNPCQRLGDGARGLKIKFHLYRFLSLPYEKKNCSLLGQWIKICGKRHIFNDILNCASANTIYNFQAKRGSPQFI